MKFTNVSGVERALDGIGRVGPGDTTPELDDDKAAGLVFQALGDGRVWEPDNDEAADSLRQKLLKVEVEFTPGEFTDVTPLVTSVPATPSASTPPAPVDTQEKQ